MGWVRRSCARPTRDGDVLRSVARREDRRIHVVELEVRSGGVVGVTELDQQVAALAEELVEPRVVETPSRRCGTAAHERVDDQVVVTVGGVVAERAVGRQVVAVERRIAGGAQLRPLHLGRDRRPHRHVGDDPRPHELARRRLILHALVVDERHRRLCRDRDGPGDDDADEHPPANLGRAHRRVAKRANVTTALTPKSTTSGSTWMAQRSQCSDDRLITPRNVSSESHQEQSAGVAPQSQRSRFPRPRERVRPMRSRSGSPRRRSSRGSRSTRNGRW